MNASTEKNRMYRYCHQIILDVVIVLALTSASCAQTKPQLPSTFATPQELWKFDTGG